VHRRVDLLDLGPGHAHSRRTRERREQPPEPPAPAPDRRPDEDRLDPRLTGQTELEVVDVAAAAAVAIDELVVEQPDREVDLVIPSPPFVRIIRGIAVSDTTMMIAR
jgi:hypothetical protein